MRLVIYTCITGGYDTLAQPAQPPTWVDFICFVPHGEGERQDGVWQIKELPPLQINDKRHLSRYPKFLPHLLLNGYDYSLWIDANIVVRSSEFYDILSGLVLQGERFAAVCHPLRDDVYDEAEACIRICRSGSDEMKNVCSFLISKDFPRHSGLTENNIIFRSHNDPAVIEVDLMWRDLFDRYPYRDQLLLGICLLSNGVKPSYIFPEGINARNTPLLEYKVHHTGSRKITRIVRQLKARLQARDFVKYINGKLHDTEDVDNSLAIVIPAYKACFFRQTLESLAEQTDKRFHVYVGDDASKDDIASICNEFSERLNITYVRFTENLGRQDLVSHWTRCVSLADEDWVWLFSDDDVLESGCVEAFHRYDKSCCDLVHFNVDVIDSDGNVVERSRFPGYLSPKDFLKRRFGRSMRSYAVEYVFRRKTFLRLGGFVNFDLAWNADDATWIRLSDYRGIHTIDGPKVHWRRSGVNITCTTDNRTATRKINASLAYLRWLNSEGYGCIGARLRWFVNTLFSYRESLTQSQIFEYMERFAAVEGRKLVYSFEKIYFIAKALKRHEGIYLSDIRQKKR